MGRTAGVYSHELGFLVHAAASTDSGIVVSAEPVLRLLPNCRPAKLGKALRDGTYRPGPDRKRKVPKNTGSGYRTIRLQNIVDRVVARAVLQIIQPLVDPTFDKNSFGFRPGKDRRHALKE